MEDQVLAERMKSIFDYLHTHPEVSWHEEQTTNYLVTFLQDIGLTPKKFDNMTGLYVDIGEGTPKVGFRTDIDALWQEIDGKFQANHSCGHDGHMTVALGVVLLLKEVEDSLLGAVRILFQPAEEVGQGAKALVKTGVVDPLEFLFGMHVRPLVELNDGTYAPALHHGAAKMISGKIEGIEAHGARPEEGINAIEVASAIVDGLKRIWIEPAASGSIKMTKLQAGGESANIIPGNAVFSIDIRAQKNKTMEQLTNGFEQVIKAVETLYGATIHYEMNTHIVASEVDEIAKNIMNEAIVDTVGPEAAVPEIVTPGGEDFHFYTSANPQLKATMLGLGCGVTPGLHHPQMTFNQNRLPTGAKIITRALELALEETNREG